MCSLQGFLCIVAYIQFIIMTPYCNVIMKTVGFMEMEMESTA